MLPDVWSSIASGQNDCSLLPVLRAAQCFIDIIKIVKPEKKNKLGSCWGLNKTLILLKTMSLFNLWCLLVYCAWWKTSPLCWWTASEEINTITLWQTTSHCLYLTKEWVSWLSNRGHSLHNCDRKKRMIVLLPMCVK